MDKTSKELIKTVGIYDSIIGIVFSLILFAFQGEKSFLFALGIMCSFINFIINAYTTNMLVDLKGGLKVLIILLSFALRIALVCVIGVKIVSISKIGFIIFIAGYTAQLLAILFYGFKLRK